MINLAVQLATEHRVVHHHRLETAADGAGAAFPADQDDIVGIGLIAAQESQLLQRG